MTDLFPNPPSLSKFDRYSLMDALEHANTVESLNVIVQNDKSIGKTPSSKLKSHFRFNIRTRVLSEKQRRHMILQTGGTLKRKLPRFIRYDGDLSLAPSSMNKSVASGNEEGGYSLDELHTDIQHERLSETEIKVDDPNSSFGETKIMQVRGKHTCGTPIPIPLHLFDDIDLAHADRWKMESDIMDNKDTSIYEPRTLDAYVHRIGNTRFISDEENPKGTFLYREDHQMHHAFNSNHDDTDDASSMNKFFDWYVRMERSTRRKKYAAIVLTVVLFVIMICMIAIFADGGNKDDVLSSPNTYSLYSNRTYPPKPLLTIPPYFDETKIPIRPPSGETWNTNSLKAMMEAFSHSSLLEDPTSYQGKAFQWILDREHLENMDATRVQQRYILATIYYCLHDEHGWTKRRGWLSSEHECTWFGIHCGVLGMDSELSMEGESRLLQDSNSQYESITHINLTYNNLHGMLPKEIQYLSSLQVLALSKNFLVGSIPEQLLPKLQQLTTLYLDENFLTGKVPDEFEQLKALRHLDLSVNSFTGTLPHSFRDLKELVDLRLHNNEMTGTIPDIFTSLTKLSVLLLGNNELDGSIPTSIGQLPNLVSLHLFENKFTGTIPKFESIVLELVHLDLNAITGSIPTFNVLPSNSPFQELRLDANQLNGSIPIDVCDLTNLKLLTLNDNRLTGTVPHELGRLESLESLQLYHNSFGGTVPESICLLKSKFKLKWLPSSCRGDAADLQCSCCDSC